MISATYCPLPWIHLCTNPTGRICLCCEDTLDSDFAGMRNFRASSGIREFRNSEYLNWIKGRMLKGEPLRECRVCYKEEERGLHSKRLSEIKNWGGVQGEQELLYADLKLGNRCNLQCLMCDPVSSSKIAEEYKEMGWDKNPPFTFGQMGIPVTEAFSCDWSWPKEDNFWKTLTDLSYRLNKVKLTGGEPLLNPYVINYLEFLRKLNKSELKIQLTTNATIVNARILSLLSNFNSDVVVSLEGVGAVNDFIRFPSQWESTLENIKQLDSASGRVRINSTLSVLNMLNISDIIEFNHQITSKRLTIMPLLFPELLNPEIVPVAMKKEATDRLDGWLMKTKVPFADYYYKQVVGRIMLAGTNLTLFEKFIFFIRAICQHRNLNLRDWLPELEFFIQQYLNEGKIIINHQTEN